MSLVEIEGKKKRYDNSVYAKRWREKNQTGSSAASKRWRSKNVEASRRANRSAKLKKAYGITLVEFEALLESQGGTCAICCTELESGSRDTHVDHCHVTGKTRAILCNGCNNMIGRAGDNAERLRAGAAYIDRWSAILQLPA